MKMKRFLTKAIAVTCALCIALAGVGCKKSVPDDENTLQMWCWDGGWGTDWYYALGEAFQEQDWVKEKYPNLNVVMESDIGWSSISGKVSAGEGVNTYDLIFSEGAREYIGKDSAGKEYSPNLTDTVYNTLVPGEEDRGLTVYDKMVPAYREAARWFDSGEAALDEDAPFQAYTYFWSDGMTGWLCNMDLLDALGLEIPLTTDEFIKICGDIKTKGTGNGTNITVNGKQEIYDSDFAISYSSTAFYLQYLFTYLWCQYEGQEQYQNFYKGIDYNGNYSNAIFAQQGRLESLKFMEELFSYNSGYLNKFGNGMAYMAAQTAFMSGEGVFMYNGNWFESEMKEIKKSLVEQGTNYKIEFIKMPIISAIVNRTPSIKSEASSQGLSNDQMLHKVVENIDNGIIDVTKAVGLGSITQEDYDIIIEARGTNHSISFGDEAYIPIYAEGKAIAMDFLRFMSTDIALEIFMRETGGASLPFQFDCKEKMGDEWFNALSDIGKSKINILNYQAYETSLVTLSNSYPLVKWGKMTALRSSSFLGLFGVNTGTRTAQDVYQETIDFYTEQVFNRCLADAGISG